MSARAESLRRDDANARARAQREFVRPLVLEAGAGTGKTATLVARVLAWALGPGWQRAEAALRSAEPSEARIAARVLDRVVAITFTEAAAAEMARRVDEALAGLLDGRTPVGVDPEALPDPSLVGVRAAALRAALDHLQVQTIHAWCRRLLAAHPLAAGIHPGFQVDADGSLCAEAARRALEARLRVAYASRDPAALALAERGKGPAELEESLALLLEQGVRAADLAEDPASPERLAALLSRLRSALEAVRDAGGAALARAPRGNAAALAGAVEAALAALPEGPSRESVERLRGALDEILPEALRNHLAKWSKASFGARESEAFGSGTAELARAAAALAALLRHVQQLDLAVLDAARALLGDALADAERALRRRGALGFAQLLTRTAALLEERPDVASAVRAGIDQLLVDEFQDTDRRQCAIVGALALEGPAASRPGLFLVGDPKQSIYGWREADLAAYEGFVQRVQDAGGSLERLSVNHRSVQAILEEVERVVAPVMRPEPGLQPAFEPLVARPDAEPGDPVEYWLPARLDGGTRSLAKASAAEATALEARALARRLQALHDEQQVAWGDMAVLTRSRGDWDVYLEALRARGIPFRVEGDRSYYRRREIVEAAAWVRCILDPGDSLALVAALRSAAVGVPDAAWIGLFAASLPERVARLAGPDPEALAGLARDALAVAAALPADVPGLERVRGWEQNLVAALAAIAELRRVFEQQAPDEFVERLRDALCFEASEAARFLGPWRAANLERFFRGLAARLADGAAPSEILRSLRRAVAEEEPSEEMQPRDLDADGVRVLTLHGAKGLDFAHVFLVQLHKGSGRRPPDVQAARVGDALEYELLGAATPGFDLVASTHERVARAERVRLLYVGMTRARTRLVLSGLWPRYQERSGDGHTELLEQRAPDPADWAERCAECVSKGISASDAAGARWRILALEDAADDAAKPGEPPMPVDLPALEAEARRLRESASRARERMARRRGGRASDDPRSEAEAEGSEVRRAARGADAARERARLVGIAVHDALERLDLAAPDPQRELLRVRAELEARLAPHAATRDLPAAAQAARALLERFGRGSLFATLCALREHVVARELPVLAVPGADDPALGFVAGTIDLVHRDPASGELVVVDYKTDRIGAGGLSPERRAAYARQGAVYASALREALGLSAPPRFELWLLEADRREVVPIR